MHRILLLLLLACAVYAAQDETPAPLTILNAAVMESEDSVPVASSFRFHPGDTLFFSFQVAGYRRTGENKVAMTYRVEAKDPSGVLIAEPMTGDVKTELSFEDKEWRPKVRQFINIPSLALPGVYSIESWVKDDIDGREARAQSTFNVGGLAVEPSETLVVRNFRFLRTEEDAARGLNPAVYRPGEVVFARFEITGFRYAEKNRMSVEYGLKVTPAGEERVIIDDPKAASEQDEGFYPKRYVPAGIQLKFQPDLPAGEYQITITVRDLIGAQEHSVQQTFRVE